MEDARGNWLGNELQYRWDTRPNNRLILGLEYQNHFRAKFRERAEGSGAFIKESSPFQVLSLYVQDEYEATDKLILTFGVRRDGYSTVGSSVNPRGALVYHPLESGTFKLLYGRRASRRASLSAPSPEDMAASSRSMALAWSFSTVLVVLP